MPSNLGFFLGGVAQQNNVTAQRQQEQQKIQLGLRKQVAEQGRTLAEQYDALVKDPNFDRERLGPVFESFLQMARIQDGNEAAVGLSGTNEARFRAKWESALTASEKTFLETEREIFNLAAKQEAGVAPPAEATPLLVKLQQQMRAAANRGDTKAVQQIQRQIDKLGTITGRTEFDVGVGGKKDIEEAQVSVADKSARLVLGGRLLTDLPKMEGATGIRGRAGEVAGGIAGILSEDLGRGVTEAISGVSPEELSGFRARARSFISERIPVMTGEESGRYTEAERKLANEALRIVSLEASPPQIRGAIETMIAIEAVAIERDRLKGGIVRPPITDSQINEIGDQLKSYGMSDAAIIGTLQDIIMLYQAFERAGLNG